MISAKKLFGSYVLQDVSMQDIANNHSTPIVSSSDVGPLFIGNCAIPSEWTSLELLEIRKYNHDTSILRFMLPLGRQRLDLPVGSFLLVKAPGSERDGKDAIRPYTSISDDGIELNHKESSGSFEILCKRYDEWGAKENKQTHFLFTKTDHSYKPPGAASNYIHKLTVGSTLDFQYTSDCVGRMSFPFLQPENRGGGVKLITMIAVGVGIAPMIHTLRAILKHRDLQLQADKADKADLPDGKGRESSTRCSIKVKLLYGVREVADILLREQLEEWRINYSDIFSVLYCVGSRWTNIHMGAKTKSDYLPPPPPRGFTEVSDHAELGWVNEDKIKRHGFPPGDDTLMVVCGLPGVYDKLCGPRMKDALSEGSALHTLGYTSAMVVKL